MSATRKPAQFKRLSTVGVTMEWSRINCRYVDSLRPPIVKPIPVLPMCVSFNSDGSASVVNPLTFHEDTHTNFLALLLQLAQEGRPVTIISAWFK